MEWLVVRNKEDESLFIQTRPERELMIAALEGFKGSINSNVIKVCDNMEDAIEYMRQQSEVDNLLDDVL